MSRHDKPALVSKHLTCCWGKMTIGPQPCCTILVLIIIFLYIGFPSIVLWKHIPIWSSLLILFLSLCLVLGLFGAVTFMDPGIVPKASQLSPDHPLLFPPADLFIRPPKSGSNRDNMDGEDVSLLDGQSERSVETSPEHGDSAFTIENSQHEGLQAPQHPRVVGMKFCQVCGIFRPLGCKHCYTCGNCVMGFDHHCPVMNQCIGQRNHGLFAGFVEACVLVLFVYCIVASVVLIRGVKQAGWTDFMAEGFTVLIVVISTFIVGLMLFLFGTQHVCYIISGQTTVGSIYGVADRKKASCLNLCRIPPSLVSFNPPRAYKRCWFVSHEDAEMRSHKSQNRV
ncbi:putative DHHC palmitoyltransferase [Blattamonas nauphoetae]|uniref:Palmitoyltransferase n=1 Tax=Blattamonas nauphoetae TaxID=2049346 RepID=A0ABQ9X7J3_9EUKA|nr:putative DHHC palmitoyltransferase [Blattamonas nauphoetae]